MQVFKSMSRVTVTLVLLALFCRRAHGDCDDALGLESGEVSHRQITSSDPSYGRSSLYTVRLNHRYDWYLWNEKKYFKIDFLDRKKITSLGIQGAGGRVTTMLWIFYSLDGQVWETYTDRSGSQDIHLAPRSASEIIKLKLDKPIQVRYIAVSPRSYRPGIRLEVYGCNSTETDNKKPTIIERDIDGNTIWTPLNSPYIIRSIVTVKASSQLYIQPGVKIIFESEDAGLVIRGKVTASGIQSLPVCFWSHKIPYKAETQWKGVNVESSGRFECNFCEIRNGETGLSGTLNSLFLQNVKFSMNGNGLELTNGGSKGHLLQRLHFVENIENQLLVAENWITRSRLVIKDSEFDGASNGILLRGQAILELDGCNISHSGRYGVKIETKTAVSISKSLFISNDEDIALSAAVNVSVDSSSFINGDVGLVFYRGSFANITNSVFKNMEKGILSRRRFEGSLAVSTSVFDSNEYGIYIHEVDNWRQSQVKVVNSTFQNGRKGDIFIECDSMSFMLEDNIFNGSYPETYPLSISTRYGYDSYRTYIVIKGNTIINYERQARLSAKRQSDGGVIELKVIENVFENLTGMYALNIDAASELIANNTFRNGVHYATLNVSGINTVIHRNIFDNKDSTYDIFTEAHYMENRSIDARYNYFGSVEKDYVASRVNGVFENMSLAEIAINPFYISTLLDKLNYGAGMFSENANAAGGELRGDVLIPDNKRLTVIRTIIIPTGVTLTVSRNVTMTFLGEIGIIVKGSLNILGTENMNVILKSGKKEGWGGIMIRNGAFLMTHGEIQGAEMVVDVPSSKCSSMLSVNVDKSEITADRISLTARNFNLSITDSKLSGRTQDFLFSTCEKTNELKLSHFVILRSDIETSKFQIITNRSDAVKLEIKVSKSNFIGVDNEMAEENRNVIFNLSRNIESEMVLSENNFSDITVVITAEKPLAKNIIVTRNQFKDSWLKISVPTIILTYNRFDSALSYSVMYIRETFTDYVINGTYNYWGTSEYLNIIAKVYDKTNNLKLPLIKVVPFFKDKLLSDVVETADFIGSNNSLGGSIEGTVHLTKRRNPYTVYSTIYVGPGNTLRIDPGVQLLFKRNTGIIVEGNIHVMGVPEAPVVFSSTNPGNPWEGVIIKGPDRNVRLTGGKDEREGKVEIRRGNSYSTVCELGFDSRDAEVICRMAGFE